MSPHLASRPDPLPLEGDYVRTVVAGTALWAVALVVLVVLLVTDLVDVRDWWLGMCGYGIALGLVGTWYCRRRETAIARDATVPAPERAN